MKYELSEQVVNNILVFLDRVQFKGFQEHQLLTEIINSLGNPIQDPIQETQTESQEQ